MSDIIPGVSWEWKPADGMISTEIERQGAFWDFTDEKLLWEAIRNGNLESRLRTEFTFTNPVWYCLWMDSPLNAAQCSILYDLFSFFIVREKELKRRLTAFLIALKEAERGHGQLEVRLGAPGHREGGYSITFAHCPRCKCIAPVPEWHASEYHDEIPCPICGTRYVPSKMYSAEYDEEPEPVDTEAHSLPKEDSRFVTVGKFIIFILLIIPWGILSLLYVIPRNLIYGSYHKIRVRRHPRSMGKSASVSSG